VLKATFQHMKAEGKPGKTALMSCMRKLLHYLNHLMNPYKAVGKQAAGNAPSVAVNAPSIDTSPPQ
jgi:hypothetical protein